MKTSIRRGGASTTPLSTRAQLRVAAREDSGLSLEQAVRRLPGKMWGLLSQAQRQNKISYLRRIERHGTPCEKTARRLAALYHCSPYLFLLEAPTSTQGQNKRRHGTRLVSASPSGDRRQHTRSRTPRVHPLEMSA